MNGEDKCAALIEAHKVRLAGASGATDCETASSGSPAFVRRLTSLVRARVRVRIVQPTSRVPRPPRVIARVASARAPRRSTA